MKDLLYVHGIFGLGTGRCGTKSLADLLDSQAGTSVSHECGGRILPWECNEHGLDAVLKTVNSFPGAIKGDVAFYYLNYVNSIFQRYPNAKFVCMKRDKTDCINSLIAKHESMNISPLQPGDKDESVWDNTMPSYPLDLSAIDCASEYYDDYYITAGYLAARHPESFRIFDTENLNTEHGVEEILDFCGIKIKNIEIGIRSNALVMA